MEGLLGGGGRRMNVINPRGLLGSSKWNLSERVFNFSEKYLLIQSIDLFKLV